MTHELLLAPLIAFVLAASPALAQLQPTAPAAKEATIPFVDHGGIDDWRSDGEQTICIRDSGHHWYKATLMNRAIDLPFAEAIGFDTGPTDTLDHFSSVIVRGQRYALQSPVRVDGPAGVKPGA